MGFTARREEPGKSETSSEDPLNTRRDVHTYAAYESYCLIDLTHAPPGELTRNLVTSQVTLNINQTSGPRLRADSVVDVIGLIIRVMLVQTNKSVVARGRILSRT